MSKIKFINVSKYFKLSNEDKKYALKSINLEFNSGLNCILGKSGSGKSTLLNMIGLLDVPSSGNIEIYGKSTNKISEKVKIRYRKETCACVFQHFHLLEEHSAVNNVIFAALIKGTRYKKAQKTALKLLNELGIDKDKVQRKVNTLSGGEKQRVAIARALINGPSVILADEPTGALDSSNSDKVMQFFKEISKSRLVIVVTHNHEIADKYADRIITIEEGNIKEIIEKNTVDVVNTPIKRNLNLPSDWANIIIKSNLKKRFFRNLISIFSLIVSITATLLILGFSYGSSKSIENETRKIFDLGVGTISNEVSEKIEGSALSLVRTTRPSKNEYEYLSKEFPQFKFSLNFDYLLSNYSFYLGEEQFSELLYTKVYAFNEKCIDRGLLIEGEIPQDNLNEALINDVTYKLLMEKLKYNPIGTYLDIKISNQITFYTGEESKPYINDYFTLDKRILIKGMVKELRFLNTPKIYYSHISMEEYMENTLLNNLSSYFQRDVSWHERIMNAPNNDQISCFSYNVFLKNIEDFNLLKNSDLNFDDLKYTNNSLVVGETLKNLISASCVGMELFLIIAGIGSCLILGILALSSYSEDRKNCAILCCLGASNSQIEEIYISENVILGIAATLLSFALATVLVSPCNLLIKALFGLSSMIDIPIKSFLGIKYGLPIIVTIGIIFLATFSTLLPIKFSKKISLREELADE